MLTILFIQIPTPKTKLIFGIILGIQILSQSITIYTYQFNIILRLQYFIWICILASCFGQMLLNFSTIEIFAVLDPRLTNQRIKRFFKSILFLIGICSLPMVILFLFETMVPLNTVANYLALGVSILTVIIDESQSIFLTMTIFEKGQKLKAYEALVMSILFLVIQFLVDWSAISLQIIQLSLGRNDTTRPLRPILQQIAVGLGSIHFAISVHVFIQFKLLFVAGFAEDQTIKMGSRPALSSRLRSNEGGKKCGTGEKKKSVQFDLPSLS